MKLNIGDTLYRLNIEETDSSFRYVMQEWTVRNIYRPRRAPWEIRIGFTRPLLAKVTRVCPETQDRKGAWRAGPWERNPEYQQRVPVSDEGEITGVMVFAKSHGGAFKQALAQLRKNADWRAAHPGHEYAELEAAEDAVLLKLLQAKKIGRWARRPPEKSEAG